VTQVFKMQLSVQ